MLRRARLSHLLLSSARTLAVYPARRECDWASQTNEPPLTVRADNSRCSLGLAMSCKFESIELKTCSKVSKNNIGFSFRTLIDSASDVTKVQFAVCCDFVKAV